MSCIVNDISFIANIFEQLFLVGITENGGVSRLGYSETEDFMHNTIADFAKDLGFDIQTDTVGNTFVSNIKDDRAYYLIGSHLDSVVNGGRYDGVAGVLAGLLVMYWAKKDGLNIPIKTVAFRCEESSNFGVCTIGSALITGHYTEGNVSGLINRNGEKLSDIFIKKGYSFPKEKISNISKYLEVHIEQGRVLEKHNQRIGIVTDIAGPRRYSIFIYGVAEHSGATPMNIRNDALCGAAELILEIEKIGISQLDKSSVATVGVVNNSPNALNVIPGVVQIQVDTRGIEKASIDFMETQIFKACDVMCKKRNLTYSYEMIGDIAPVKMSEKVSTDLKKATQALGISCREMISGAGHDAMEFADICDTALVFIPCRKGISHNKDEFSQLESIRDGASVIYQYLKEEVKTL